MLMVEHKTLNERYYEIQLTAIDKYLNLSISQIFMGQHSTGAANDQNVPLRDLHMTSSWNNF